MIENRTSYRRAPRGGFSLLEILAVLAIIFILVGMSVPAMQGLLTGPSLSTATTEVVSAVEQARLRALALGSYVGLYVVDDVGDENEALVKYALFEVADLGEGGIYETLPKPVQITKWQTLPQGIVFMKGDSAALPSILDLPRTEEWFGIRGIEGNGYETFSLNLEAGTESARLPGIVFGPNGSVVAPRLSGEVRDLDLPVIEGFSTGTGNGWTAQVPERHEDRRFNVVRVGRLSGSVRKLRQEEYTR